MSQRNLDIGFATFGDEMMPARGTTIGLDPNAAPDLPESEQFPDVIQLAGLAENLPIRSSSLDRVTSSNTVGTFADFEESIEEIVRVLRPGGVARIKTDTDSDTNLSEMREILNGLPIDFKIRTSIPDPDDNEVKDFIIILRKRGI